MCFTNIFSQSVVRFFLTVPFNEQKFFILMMSNLTIFILLKILVLCVCVCVCVLFKKSLSNKKLQRFPPGNFLVLAFISRSIYLFQVKFNICHGVKIVFHLRGSFIFGTWTPAYSSPSCLWKKNQSFLRVLSWHLWEINRLCMSRSNYRLYVSLIQVSIYVTITLND